MRRIFKAQPLLTRYGFYNVDSAGLTTGEIEIGTPGNADILLYPSGNVLLGSVSATPLPAALPLFGSALGMMGLIGWRRKRKNATAIGVA